MFPLLAGTIVVCIHTRQRAACSGIHEIKTVWGTPDNLSQRHPAAVNSASTGPGPDYCSAGLFVLMPADPVAK